MDLRPKLADDFLEAIIEDLTLKGVPVDTELREKWKGLILERFESSAIECEDCNLTFCTHEKAIQAFIEKYPGHRPLLDYVKAGILKEWPEATFSLELISDWEHNSEAWENQNLGLRIRTGAPSTKEGKTSIAKLIYGKDSTPYHEGIHGLHLSYGVTWSDRY